jgi:hypothetical protein
MGRKFCKSCAYCYFNFKVDQCSFESGITQLRDSRNFYICSAFGDKVDEERLKLLFAMGYLNKHDYEFFIDHAKDIHVINGKVIGHPTKLNVENDCPFHKLVIEKNEEGEKKANKLNKIDWKFVLKLTIYSSLFFLFFFFFINLLKLL